MTVLKERELSRGPRVAAVGGNDVVAYQTMHLFSGIDHDVKGSGRLSSKDIYHPQLFSRKPNTLHHLWHNTRPTMNFGL